MNFALKLWNWIFNRSPQNAAKPNTAIPLSQDPFGVASSHDDIPIETYSENQFIQDSTVKVGWEEYTFRTSEGHLIRTRNNFALRLGCGHIVRQQQAIEQPDRRIRGIAGTCFYCRQELLKAISRGEISPFEAESLWLVCSECGKITVSGHLCCPKHYTTIINPAGTAIYLGPEDVKEQKRQQLTISFLGRILDLFLQEEPEEEKPDKRKPNDVTGK